MADWFDAQRDPPGTVNTFGNDLRFAVVDLEIGNWRPAVPVDSKDELGDRPWTCLGSHDCTVLVPASGRFVKVERDDPGCSAARARSVSEKAIGGSTVLSCCGRLPYPHPHRAAFCFSGARVILSIQTVTADTITSTHGLFKHPTHPMLGLKCWVGNVGIMKNILLCGQFPKTVPSSVAVGPTTRRAYLIDWPSLPLIAATPTTERLGACWSWRCDREKRAVYTGRPGRRAGCGPPRDPEMREPGFGTVGLCAGLVQRWPLNLALGEIRRR